MDSLSRLFCGWYGQERNVKIFEDKSRGVEELWDGIYVLHEFEHNFWSRVKLLA